MVGQVVDPGGNHFQPSKMANNIPQSKEEGSHIDPKLKANMELIKANKGIQRAIVQYSQLLLKVHGKKKGSTMTNDPRSGVSTHLMTNVNQ